jgi:hypothetical protein
MIERKYRMKARDLPDARWRASSYSGTDSNCVEVAAESEARVLVRDTKDREGPVLAFPPGAWRRFAAQVKVRLPD